jgi:tRNA-2-methylthio-N6-dimethylallyladenosine synthase
MAKFYIWTIGCQMNKADSEFIAACLEQAGYSPTTIAERADFILLNSCVVRQGAEDKVINKLSSLKRLKEKSPHAAIALTGCLVDSKADELKKCFPWVDLFFRPQQWEVLFQWAESQRLPCPDKKTFFLPPHPPVSAFIPIIQGCNSFCSYCIVPYRRGRERSRDLEDICCQVQSLVQRGVKEVTLLGQSVDSYGHDLASRPDLADLLAELNKIEGLLRIRFLTNHPKDMSQKLIQAVAELEKVCEHISLPIQAGDNEILRAMRRGYTVEQYQVLVKQIRSTIPGVALSTDVIVSFPGETKEQFERTLDLLRQIRFDKVHIAAYSPRPGTIAARRLEDNVLPEEKELRRIKAEALQQCIAAEINASFLGKTVEVLVEGEKKGKWQGRTRGDKLVFFTDSTNLLGQLVKVSIERASPWALQGKILPGSINQTPCSS